MAKTLNLDKLAAGGVVFGRCYTNSPLCGPARASLITGQYVNEHGVWSNGIEFDCHGPSHVRNIRDAGYHTAVIGKAHLWLHGGRNRGSHTNEHVGEMHNWGYIDIHELTGPGASAIIGSPYLDHLAEKGFLTVYHEYLQKAKREGSHPWELVAWPLPIEDHYDMYTAIKAEEWIQNYQGDRPFYLQVCFPGPHSPFDSPAEYRAMYAAHEMPPSIMDKPVTPLSPLVERRSKLDDMSESQNRVMRMNYYGEVSLIDDGIGRLLKALEDKGVMDNTWIIHTSDHGEMLGDHRLMEKSVFYEGALNVPCIIRPPGKLGGWKSNALTDLLDVAASLLEIAGAKPFEGSDGSSLVPKIMAGPHAPDAQKGKEVVFSEVEGYSMVRSERYKMAVDSRTRQPVELYDVVNDSNELRNLVDDPSLEKVRRELLDGPLNRLLSHLDEVKYKVFEDMEQG